MEIVRLATGRVGEASAMLARAFQDDPAWEWVVPNPRRRAALLPWLFQVNFEVTEAEVWVTAGAIEGCARWLPPGRPVIHIGAMLRALVATPLRVREATSRFLAYADRRRPAAVAGRHRHRPAATRLRGVQPRPGSLRAPDQQRGERRVLRQPRLRGHSRGTDARGRPAGVGDAAGARLGLPG